MPLNLDLNKFPEEILDDESNTASMNYSSSLIMDNNQANLNIFYEEHITTSINHSPNLANVAALDFVEDGNVVASMNYSSILGDGLQHNKSKIG
ncbi:unnamed protein product [Lathyrus sativus]|nr:unnamed protein product [Lathyrus sativus]